MSNFVKEIRTIIEQVVHDCNIPVRPHFPINVVSHSTAFRPRKCVIEVLVTEDLSDERRRNFDHYLMEYFGRKELWFSGTYWPPSGTGTGSLLIRVTET